MITKEKIESTDITVTEKCPHRDFNCMDTCYHVGSCSFRDEIDEVGTITREVMVEERDDVVKRYKKYGCKRRGER
jgi:hypothetical protein